jgi:hypothetical protein
MFTSWYFFSFMIFSSLLFMGQSRPQGSGYEFKRLTQVESTLFWVLFTITSFNIEFLKDWVLIFFFSFLSMWLSRSHTSDHGLTRVNSDLFLLFFFLKFEFILNFTLQYWVDLIIEFHISFNLLSTGLSQCHDKSWTWRVNLDWLELGLLSFF